MTVPTTPSVPVKELEATITLKFRVPTDPQEFGFYDNSKQAEELEKRLNGDDLLDYITDQFNDDTLIINVDVEVVDPKNDAEDDEDDVTTDSELND